MVAVAVAPPPVLLFPRQKRFVQDQRSYPAYIGGIGSGKTFAGAAKVISRLTRKELGMIAAPTYPMLRDATRRTLTDMLDVFGIEYELHKTENVITIPRTGHEILCRSLDNPDTLRGPNLAYAWVDEGALISREAWRIVKGRVRDGDSPQAWVTSTPKGRNYLWEEWERDATGNEFDPSHPLYRVRTTENYHLPDGWAEGLGYSDAFLAQEIGGEFVAFDGLIYPAFQREVNVCAVDTTGWRTILGGDIGARNPTALLTIRRAGDGRTHIERERYQRNMGSDDITDAICDEMRTSGAAVGWLDPSAKAYIDACVLRGFNVKGANNDVKHGIGVVTTAFADGLTVDPSCVNTIAEFESYAWQDGATEKDAPIKQNDHACFVAGTMIATASGERPIETIQPGDLVQTRAGLRPVIAAGMTHPSADVLTVTFSDGRTLTGTSNHPLWIADRGWIRFDTLRYGDIIQGPQEALECESKPSSIAASSSAAIPNRRTLPIRSITDRMRTMFAPGCSRFTGKSGKITTGQSLPAGTSITSTATNRTMRPRIWTACQPQSISRFMAAQRQIDNALTLRASVTPLPHGTAPKRAEHGTVNTDVRHGRSANQSSAPATNAASRSTPSADARTTGSAPMRASRHGVVLLALMTLTAFAPRVAKPSAPASTARFAPAPAHVVAVSKAAQRQAVYNLTVSDTPEYFANGALVHNCDALRYALVGDDVPQPTIRLW